MGKYFKTLWKNWRYYSFAPDALRSCFPQIQSHNIGILRITSLLAVALLVGFIFFPVFIEKNLWKSLAFIVVVIIQASIFFYATYQRKNPNTAKDRNFTVYCVLFFSLLSFGVYIAVLSAYTIPAVNFYIFLVFSQILFIFDPIWNLFLNITVLGLLCFFSLHFDQLGTLEVTLVNGVAAGVVGMTFSWYASYIVIREMLTAKKLEEERSRFKEQSIKDELTGLSNRRDFLNSVTLYTSVCQHVHQTICVIMMDVDHFKDYNDFYGHAQGDLVLKMIGNILKKLVQEELVFAARVGGEEFIILWIENRLTEAERLALKLKQMINDLRIPHVKSNTTSYITASYGLYILRGGSMDSADELYQKADQALYEAKNRGRNQIILLDSGEPSVFQSVE